MSNLHSALAPTLYEWNQLVAGAEDIVYIHWDL